MEGEVGKSGGRGNWGQDVMYETRIKVKSKDIFLKNSLWVLPKITSSKKNCLSQCFTAPSWHKIFLSFFL